MEDKIITFEEVEERLKNVPLEKYTYNDVFDRYVAYGEDYELAQVEVQKLFIKYGMIEDLVLAVESIITDKEVINAILSSNIYTHKKYEIVKGKIESIQFADLEDKELAKGGCCWLIINFLDENSIDKYKIKYMYYPPKQESYKNEVEQNIGKDITVIVNRELADKDFRLCCFLPK